MFTGRLTDKTSLAAEQAGGETGLVLIVRLCLAAAKHSPWLRPNCNPMILICPITSFSCSLRAAAWICVCVCVTESACMCVPSENRGFVVTDCAVWCSCVRFRCFYTKDEMIDERCRGQKTKGMMKRIDVYFRFTWAHFAATFVTNSSLCNYQHVYFSTQQQHLAKLK